MTKESDLALKVVRKRLIFRSWHRGTRELDLILGSFADRYVPGFSADELQMYDEMIQENDPELYKWYTEKSKPPPDKRHKVYEMFLRHKIIHQP